MIDKIIERSIFFFCVSLCFLAGSYHTKYGRYKIKPNGAPGTFVTQFGYHVALAEFN